MTTTSKDDFTSITDHELATPKSKFYSIIGLGGVHHLENKRAQYWGQVFEWPMILLAVGILFIWYIETTGYSLPLYTKLSDGIIWLFFLAEFSVLLCLCDNKLRYVRRNWLNLFIILAGIPILWGDVSYAALLRTGRLIIMMALLVSVFDSIKEVLSRNHLGVTLLISSFFILFAGVLVSGFDPEVKNPWMGIWWAWVTVTTVGYGDVVPASIMGKLLGGLLILLGIGLFSMLTASFSAFFISKNKEKSADKENMILFELQKMNLLLHSIQDRLYSLEQSDSQKQQRPEKPSEPGASEL